MNNLKLIHLLIRDTIDNSDTPLTESQIEALSGDIDNLYQTAHLEIPGYRDIMENININEATLRDLIFRMIAFEDFQKSITSDEPPTETPETLEDHPDQTYLVGPSSTDLNEETVELEE